MLNTAPILSLPARAGVAAAPPATAPDTTAAPFAQALDRATAQQRGAGEEPAGDKQAEGATKAAPGSPDPAATPLRAAARKAAAPGGVAPSSADAPAAAAVEEDASLPVVADDDDAPAVDAQDPFDLAAWLPGLPLPPAAVAPQAPRDSEPTAAHAARPGVRPLAGRGTAVDEVAALPEKPGPALAGAQDAPGRASSAPDPNARHGVAPPTELAGVGLAPSPTPVQGKERETAAAGLVQGSAALRAAQVVDAVREVGTPASISPAGVIASALAPSTPSAASPDMPFHAELKAALGTPQFAPALGSQLNVLVRDGIEHARLKLNPAEMGPIDVRISLDGQQAQVDFSAAHAGTRQILQDAVPALASALREAGLTLTGGGVFDQAREQRGDTPRDASSQRMPAFDEARDGLPASVTLPRPTRSRGVVDLYA